MPAAKLEKIRPRSFRFLSRLDRQLAVCRGRPDRSTVIQEGHRQQIVAEHAMTHPHKRQDSSPLAVAVHRDLVQRLVTQNVRHDLPPPKKMAEATVLLRRDEVIPLGSAAGKRSDREFGLFDDCQEMRLPF